LSVQEAVKAAFVEVAGESVAPETVEVSAAAGSSVRVEARVAAPQGASAAEMITELPSARSLAEAAELRVAAIEGINAASTGRPTTVGDVWVTVFDIPVVSMDLALTGLSCSALEPEVQLSFERFARKMMLAQLQLEAGNLVANLTWDSTVSGSSRRCRLVVEMVVSDTAEAAVVESAFAATAASQLTAAFGDAVELLGIQRFSVTAKTMPTTSMRAHRDKVFLPLKALSWALTAWSDCTASCGEGVRSRGVSCPSNASGVHLACDGSGPRPKVKEACRSNTGCGWCPFGMRRPVSCSLQRALLLVALAVVALGCCIFCFMRLRKRPRAKVHESAFVSVAPASDATRTGAGPTDKAVDKGDSTSTTDDLSYIQTIRCMHCIGEPPGHWEVLDAEHAEMAGGHIGYPEPPTQTQGSNVHMAGLEMEEIDFYGDNYESFYSDDASSRESTVPVPNGRGNAAYMESSRHGCDTEHDVANCGSCGAPSMMLAVCGDLGSTRATRAADVEWERAMQVIEKTSQEVSQLTAEGRIAPRSQRLEIHKRVRTLESSPDYVWAMRYLEHPSQRLSTQGDSIVHRQQVTTNVVASDWQEGMTVKL